MSLDYVKFSNGFEKFMPKEYRDMVEHGPFGKKTTVSQMGTFKEILEEHPMCAGCAMTLFIRLAIIAFPNPEDTITVGTAGCGRLAISQAAIPFVYGNYGDQNGVASGLSRGLRLRFGDKPKDVVVMVGDGGMAYNIHAVWQQEVWAAVERSRKYINQYMGGLLSAENMENADAVIIASGSAAAQSREAARLCADKGIKVGLIKVRSLRPFPTDELRKLCKDAKLIVIPEFNYVGWLAREVATAIYGHSKAKIIAGPHVYGGQSMPVELILDEVESGLTGKKSTNVPLSAIMGADVNQADVTHFMQNI